MFAALLRLIRRHTRRAVALALAPGLLVLAFDAGVAHYAGTEEQEPLQLLPVVFGVAACLALLVVAVPRVGRGAFAVVLRVLGGLGLLVGVLGCVVHALALWRELEGELGAAALEGALSVAPPLFAPAAFAAVGALLWLVASPRLLLRLRVGEVARQNVVPLTPAKDGRDGHSNGLAR